MICWKSLLIFDETDGLLKTGIIYLNCGLVLLETCFIYKTCIREHDFLNFPVSKGNLLRNISHPIFDIFSGNSASSQVNP